MYLGPLFTGFQRGNGVNSVEDRIISILQGRSLGNYVQAAARTDRNVSAADNAFTIDTQDDPEKVIRILNSEIEGMYFHSFAAVDDNFRARYSDSKTYSYLIFEKLDIDRLNAELKKFTGTHDFTRFSRRDYRNPVRTINSISTLENDRWIEVNFTARSFVWNQIRYIMGYALEALKTGTDIDPFDSAKEKPKLAPPENLILSRITYSGVKFQVICQKSKLKRLLMDRSRYFAMAETVNKLLSETHKEK
ncbi:MAG: hypothetical protein QXV22_01980 [Thermoplasmataceae archaeon]